MEECVVCHRVCISTPYYRTQHGCVCEDCYEAASGVKSYYQEWLESDYEN